MRFIRSDRVQLSSCPVINALLVPAAHDGGANPDLGDDAGGISDGDNITHLDWPLEQDNEPADEVGHDLLQAEADAHAEGGHEPLYLGPGEPEVLKMVKAAEMTMM